MTVEGSPIEYQAVAGTIVVHPKGWDDAATAEEQKSKENEESDQARRAKEIQESDGRSFDVLRGL